MRYNGTVGHSGTARSEAVPESGESMSDRDATETADPSQPTTVVLSEFVPRHIWEYPLHNQTALRLKLRLFFRRNTVVIDVPYHLGIGPGGKRDRPGMAAK